MARTKAKVETDDVQEQEAQAGGEGFEFPETWEAFCKEFEWAENLPEMIPPHELPFRAVANLEKLYERSRLAYATFEDENPADVVENLDVRADVAEDAIGFFRDDCMGDEEFESFLNGTSVDAVFSMLMILLRYYMVQVGKNTGSKLSSTRTR
ncbi:hypothetical protein [Bifidobacterium cuniculi]|uniref:Uncharacterized protein n=1 Tax=Bifidobacterium cuniculi TaxID=1688 RepID=A0A087AFG7_9BIFI|nr:hypothetical protein [Bifidobacterium cuniculi]KFI57517.1 hypothetical protein BCUN_1865 [Bifidobacterium cuniculi]